MTAPHPLHLDLRGCRFGYALAGHELFVTPYRCHYCPETHATVHAWPQRRGAVPVERPERDHLWIAPPCGRQAALERVEVGEETGIMMSNLNVGQVPVKTAWEAWDQLMGEAKPTGATS